MKRILKWLAGVLGGVEETEIVVWEWESDEERDRFRKWFRFK